MGQSWAGCEGKTKIQGADEQVGVSKDVGGGGWTGGKSSEGKIRIWESVYVGRRTM